MLHIGGRQRGVRVVRGRGEAARKREQALAFVVQNMLLLAIEIFEREAIHGKPGIRRHPFLQRRQRNCQHLRIEPRARLPRLGEQNLDLLPPRVDRVVPLILVVHQRRVVPDLVGQLADLIRQRHRGEQLVRAARERPLKRGVRGDFRLEFVVGGLPCLPTLEDMRQVPFEPRGNAGSIALLGRSGGLGRRHRIHQKSITPCQGEALRAEAGPRRDSCCRVGLEGTPDG